MTSANGPRVVLGICDGLHDAGAALVVDRRLVAAANEERFTRRKLQGGMPHHAVADVLAHGGVRAGAVDVVAVAGHATPTLPTRLVRSLQDLYGPSMGICFDRPWHPADRLGDLVRYRLGLTRLRGGRGPGRVEAHVAHAVLARTLPVGLRTRPLVLVDHHLAHAESAWRTAGAGTWLVVTADAHGDGRSLTVHVARADRPGAPLTLLHEEGVRTSLGAFYALVTKALGFLPGRHEGKVQGLAASGEAARVGIPFPFAWEGGRLVFRGAWGLAGSRRLAHLAALRREDVAAWVQEGTEQAVIELVRRWLRATGARRLALAGGLFANVRMNGRLAALEEVERVHVFPHMGDGGLAVGAALHVAGAAPSPLGALTDLARGPTEQAWARAAEGSGLPAHRPRDPDAVLLEGLAAGLPVVRCVGGMEYGPRALGHRSVLAPPDRPDLLARLGEALRREEFMPFAPALAWEDARAAFEGFDAAAGACRFMTVALTARSAFARACPGVIHVDGTARPQAVSREDAPDFLALLEAWRARTGRPALVNTSFNLHEEPIVRTPREAVRALRLARLPMLRLGPWILVDPQSPFASEAARRHRAAAANVVATAAGA